MDRTLSVVLAILAVASAIFLAAISLTAYAGISYRATFSGTYEYRVSISSDTPLGNVTLYIPIPARGMGSSEVLEKIGSGGLQGLPAGWEISLIGTEKFTMLEVTAREMDAAPVGRPYHLSVDAPSDGGIDTRNPESGGLVLAPVVPTRPGVCGDMESGPSPGMRCEHYDGMVYADFTGPANARLTILTVVTGRNSWDVFGPSSNEYHEGLQVSFSGGERGWRTGEGIRASGIGDYGIDFWVKQQ